MAVVGNHSGSAADQFPGLVAIGKLRRVTVGNHPLDRWDLPKTLESIITHKAHAHRF